MPVRGYIKLEGCQWPGMHTYDGFETKEISFCATDINKGMISHSMSTQIVRGWGLGVECMYLSGVDNY